MFTPVFEPHQCKSQAVCVLRSYLLLVSELDFGDVYFCLYMQGWEEGGGGGGEEKEVVTVQALTWSGVDSASALQ